MNHQDITRARTPSGSELRGGPGPIRTCVGCRQRATRRELLRVTVASDTDGEPVVVADLHRTRPGRGAHVHPTPECHDLAVRRKAYGRALRVSPGVRVAPMESHLRPAPTDQAGQTRNRSGSS